MKLATAVQGTSNIWGSSLIEAGKSLARRMRVGPLFRWRFSGFSPQQILAHPVDLNLADPSLAHEFYHGRFALAGRVVQAGSVSPFTIEPPTIEWEEALHDFSWLRHMEAAKTELASAHARSLLTDWIDATGRRIRGLPWRADITARRIMAWLSHSKMLLEGSSPAFSKQFMRSLGLQVRYLRTAINNIGENQGRLEACIALACAALALPVSNNVARNTRRDLEREIVRQILPDGGHISRNPAVLISLLAQMISLRHTYSESNDAAPPMLIAAVDRMLPALRFFQHRDHTLANFNGVGPILPDRLNVILGVDETAGIPFTNAPHSGYQRLAFGKTMVIVDTGRSPLGGLSTQANAGCLSFEMSSGDSRFIVNCGVDPYGPQDFRFFGRLTAAHSTATINDTSSCRFRQPGKADSAITAGPTRVRVKRIEQDERVGFIAAHDGYARNFNLIHQRSMTLSKTGDLLEGADHFSPVKKSEAPAQEKNIATVRFHLHPNVEVSRGEDHALRLEVLGSDIWTFTSEADIRLEDSIYFCGLNGPTKTRQIVLFFDVSDTPEVYWAFRRETPAKKEPKRENGYIIR